MMTNYNYQLSWSSRWGWWARRWTRCCQMPSQAWLTAAQAFQLLDAVTIADAGLLSTDLVRCQHGGQVKSEAEWNKMKQVKKSQRLHGHFLVTWTFKGCLEVLNHVKTLSIFIYIHHILKSSRPSLPPLGERVSECAPAGECVLFRFQPGKDAVLPLFPVLHVINASDSSTGILGIPETCLIHHRIIWAQAVIGIFKFTIFHSPNHGHFSYRQERCSVCVHFDQPRILQWNVVAVDEMRTLWSKDLHSFEYPFLDFFGGLDCFLKLYTKIVILMIEPPIFHGWMPFAWFFILQLLAKPQCLMVKPPFLLVKPTFLLVKPHFFAG